MTERETIDRFARQVAQVLRRLEEAIVDLPESQRETFLLRYRHDLAYEDIAEITGRPLGTVKTHIHRARQRLAEMLEDVLGTEP